MAQPKRPHRWRQAYIGKECRLAELAMIGWDRFPVAQPCLAGHVHEDAYEICCLVSGAVDWWAGDEVSEVGPGDLYITRPGERHGGEAAVMNPCELYWVQVKMPLPSGTLAEPDRAALDAGLRAISTRRFPGEPAIADCCQRMLREIARPSPLADLLMRSALHELLARVLDCYQRDRAQQGARQPSSAISDALHWLNANYAQDVSLAQLPREAALAPSQFHERFLLETGYTPGQYRTRLRIVAAKRALRQSATPVTDLAHQLGFSTSQYFATAFKKHVGMSPLEYRRRLRLRD